MSKITLIETLEWVPVSGSKLYQDAADGVFSTEKNKQGRKVVDVAALEGAYGKLRNPQEDDVESETDDHGHPESSNGHPASSNGASPHLSESVQLLELQVSMLETQLTRASASEQTLIIGPCCHGDDEVEVYWELCEIVEEWIEIACQENETLHRCQFSGKCSCRLG